MKPEPPLEYCALRFLHQWQRRERVLHQQMSDNPSLLQIRSALQYFQVARNFKGLGTDEAAPQAVANAFRQVDGDPRLSPERKVFELASRFEERFDHFNLAAASKLFWLKHRRPYIIYDSRAVKALRDLGCKFENANYTEYCECWRKQYRRRRKQIKQAASRLHVVRKFLPQAATKSQLSDFASHPWFLERVFDIYLWEMGGEA